MIIMTAISILLVVAVSLYLSDQEMRSRNGELQTDTNSTLYDKFAIEGIDIVNRGEDNRITFSLSADKVVHRKRISKLFVYQNLKEIYLSGVKINIFNSLNKKQNSNQIAFNDMGNSLISLGKPSTQIEDFIEGKADIGMDFLTRMLFENLYINMYFSHGNKISIEATTATLNTDFKNIILKGMVKIVSSDSREFNTSEAVWSKKYNGIYFPKGYSIEKSLNKGEAFFVISQNGKFTRLSDMPKIDYIDWIEEKEEMFYASLSKKIPKHIKLSFGDL